MRPRLGFLRDLGTIAAGSGSAQVISLLAMPVITRLFSPEDFGVASVFLTCAFLGSTVASLRYDLAISLPGDDQQARQLLALAASIAIGFALLLELGVLVGEIALRAGGRESPFQGWLPALPFMVLLIAVGVIGSEQCTRDRAFRRMAAAAMGSAVALAAFRIGFGYALGSSVGVLLVGSMLGEAVRATILGGRRLVERARTGFDRRAFGAVAREYADFPRRSVPTALVHRSWTAIPVLAIGPLYGAEAVGIYALVERALRNPLAILGQAVHRAFMRRAAEQASRGRSLIRPFLLLTSGLLAISAGPLLVVSLFGEQIMGWIFGERWAGAGLYVTALVPMLLTILPMPVTNVVLVVQRRLGILLLAHSVLLVSVAGVFLAAALNAWEALFAVRVFAWTACSINLLLIGAGAIIASRVPPAGPSDDELPS